MYRPHARVAQLAAGLGSSGLQRGGVFKLGYYAMAGHFAVGVAGRSYLQLGAQHQRVGKLPDGAHGRIGNCAIVAADKIHHAKADGLHPRVRGNGKGVVHGEGRFAQHMNGQIGAASGVNQLHGYFHIGHGIDFRNHQMAQLLPHRGHDGFNIQRKARVVDRMHAHRHAALHASDLHV